MSEAPRDDGRSLSSLRRVATAEVFKKGQRAAQLRRSSEGDTVLSYRKNYLGPAIASTLPVTEAQVRTRAGGLPPFFAGLLPEGRRLIALQRASKTSIDDELTLLLAVGHDTVGDVQVTPEGETPRLPTPVVQRSDFSAVRFRELFERVTGGSVVDRAAIPGAQNKVSASDMLSVPVGVGPVPCILKLNPPEFPFLVQNERFFLEQAQKCGVPAARAKVLVDADGEHGLLVERFDRKVSTGESLLLTQEDGCQAASRYPADKYNLTAEETIGTLASLTPAGKVTALSLMRQMAFAYLTGNGDMHAKNLSVLECNGELRASPAYDVLSTHPYGDTTMALSIDGKDRENITRKSFLALGAYLGVPSRATERMLDVLLRKAHGLTQDVAQLPFDEKARHKLARLIADRASKLA